MFVNFYVERQIRVNFANEAQHETIEDPVPCVENEIKKLSKSERLFFFYTVAQYFYKNQKKALKLLINNQHIVDILLNIQKSFEQDFEKIETLKRNHSDPLVSLKIPIIDTRITRKLEAEHEEKKASLLKKREKPETNPDILNKTSKMSYKELLDRQKRKKLGLPLEKTPFERMNMQMGQQPFFGFQQGEMNPSPHPNMIQQPGQLGFGGMSGPILPQSQNGQILPPGLINGFPGLPVTAPGGIQPPNLLVTGIGSVEGSGLGLGPPGVAGGALPPISVPSHQSQNQPPLQVSSNQPGLLQPGPGMVGAGLIPGLNNPPPGANNLLSGGLELGEEMNPAPAETKKKEETTFVFKKA